MAEISPLALRLAPLVEDINKLLASYRTEFFANAQPEDDSGEHMRLWVKTVMWPLFSSVASEPDMVQRILLGQTLVEQVRGGTFQLFQIAVTGEDEIRRRHNEISKELDR